MLRIPTAVNLWAFRIATCTGRGRHRAQDRDLHAARGHLEFRAGAVGPSPGSASAIARFLTVNRGRKTRTVFYYNQSGRGQDWFLARK